MMTPIASSLAAGASRRILRRVTVGGLPDRVWRRAPPLQESVKRVPRLLDTSTKNSLGRQFRQRDRLGVDGDMTIRGVTKDMRLGGNLLAGSGMLT
jgi:hypothetical protein